MPEPVILIVSATVLSAGATAGAAGYALMWIKRKLDAIMSLVSQRSAESLYMNAKIKRRVELLIHETRRHTRMVEAAIPAADFGDTAPASTPIRREGIARWKDAALAAELTLRLMPLADSKGGHLETSAEARSDMAACIAADGPLDQIATPKDPGVKHSALTVTRFNVMAGEKVAGDMSGTKRQNFGTVTPGCSTDGMLVADTIIPRSTHPAKFSLACLAACEGKSPNGLSNAMMLTDVQSAQSSPKPGHHATTINKRKKDDRMQSRKRES